MASLPPVFVDGERVKLHGAERPDVQKVLEACGVDSGTYDVWRLDGADDPEGDLLGRADVLDRTLATDPIFLRLQKSEGRTPLPEEGVGLGVSPGAAVPLKGATDTSGEVPEGPGSTRFEGSGGGTASYEGSGQPAAQKFGLGVQENPLGGEQASRMAGRRRGRGEPMQLPDASGARRDDEGGAGGASSGGAGGPLGRAGSSGKRPRPLGQGYSGYSDGSRSIEEREWTAGLRAPAAPQETDAQRKDVSSRRDRPETSASHSGGKRAPRAKARS